MLVFATIAVLATLAGCLWNWMEENIVEKYTFAFKTSIMTNLEAGTTNNDKTQNDPRDNHINLFVKFFLSKQTTYNLFGKYVFVSLINTVLHVLIFLFFAWLLFEDIGHITDPERYLDLINLAVTDDLNQERKDNMATLFPSLYSCQIPLTGPSGSIFNVTVTCYSTSNPKIGILHVMGLFFSMFMIGAYIVDTLMLLVSMLIFPTSYASYRINKMKKLTFSKRLIFLLFQKNTETLVWDEFCELFFKSIECNKDDLQKIDHQENNQSIIEIQDEHLQADYETMF